MQAERLEDVGKGHQLGPWDEEERSRVEGFHEEPMPACVKRPRGTACLCPHPLRTRVLCGSVICFQDTNCGAKRGMKDVKERQSHTQAGVSGKN